MSHQLTVDAPRRSPLRVVLTILGVAAVVATYAFLIVSQPADVVNGPTAASALVALAGFGLAMVLLFVGILPTLPTTTLALIPVALVLNIVLGQFVGSTLVPIYLDSIGTVLVGFLAGPSAGAATGLLSNLVWSFFNPSVLPFAAGAAAIGALAGVAARLGIVRRFYLVPVAGVVTGFVAAAIAAPIAVIVFGGTATGATGAVIALFRAAGDSLVQSVTTGAFTSDLPDKLVTFSLAAALAYALPRRSTRRFEFVRRHRVLAGAKRSVETADTKAAPAA
ncbi:ECF transporter S component [Sinomonas sp. ASV322]|uniref:ECF transporter S component n=1 Tax=Sinomonas sp. ASV322 TaxID=3041920 RepID=UPI0027DEA5F0|nr:ECF transporter S component [Sinomonas sp. ASV322]MDQ4500883.1 ECF transporter S component [Sinomonas sp. ASV322]